MNATELNAALTGSYTIVNEVGIGLFATVYLARDDHNDRLVALKVLKPELSAVLAVDRFLAEIRVTSNLHHPNLVPLFDCGRTEGTLYYVTPFVEGENLRRRLDREKQLPVEEAIRIATAVGGALDHAHRQGVIHRDLRPENILFEGGRVFVVDFGLALAITNAGGPRLAQTGLAFGAPQYMSPELATGDRVIDSRADLFSLAAITYEMLTGAPPHTGATPQEVTAKVLTESARSARLSRPTVPEHTDAAIARALSKQPGDRHVAARDLVEGLTGRSLTPPRPSVVARPKQPSQFMRMLPWVLVGVAAVAGFVAGRLSG
jgi:eukaryotic-like serine/threonine-protein kinase